MKLNIFEGSRLNFIVEFEHIG